MECGAGLQTFGLRTAATFLWPGSVLELGNLFHPLASVDFSWRNFHGPVDFDSGSFAAV